MIGRISGVLLEKQAPWIVVEVQGIGYEIQVPMSSYYQLPECDHKVNLYTHLVVREDDQSLYGFFTKQERTLFRTLIKISGVGPRLALTILSGVEPEIFMQCIANDDISSLVRLPGIGRKTAQRLIIELRDKLSDWQTESGVGAKAGTPAKDAISALLALGYKAHEANQAVNKYKEQQLSSEELIKRALRDLSG